MKVLTTAALLSATVMSLVSASAFAGGSCVFPERNILKLDLPGGIATEMLGNYIVTADTSDSTVAIRITNYSTHTSCTLKQDLVSGIAVSEDSNLVLLQTGSGSGTDIVLIDADTCADRLNGKTLHGEGQWQISGNTLVLPGACEGKTDCSPAKTWTFDASCSPIVPAPTPTPAP